VSTLYGARRSHAPPATVGGPARGALVPPPPPGEATGARARSESFQAGNGCDERPLGGLKRASQASSASKGNCWRRLTLHSPRAREEVNERCSQKRAW